MHRPRDSGAGRSPTLTSRLRKFAVVAAALSLLILIALPRLGPWLVVEDPLDKADAIIVLSGTTYERPLEAVDLYQSGYARHVVLIREMEDWGELALAERGIDYMRPIDLQIDTMRRLGVPREAIEVIEPVDNTADEAMHVRDYVASRHYTRLIIVTSKQHTRRARLVMRRRLAGSGATLIMRASRYDRSDVEHWWRQRSTLRFTLFETQRLFAYWIGVAD